MSLDQAIADLEAEVAAFKQGSKDQPKENTREWFLLRAKVYGLSLLKQMKADGVHLNPAAAEKLFQRAAKATKHGDETGTAAEAS